MKNTNWALELLGKREGRRKERRRAERLTVQRPGGERDKRGGGEAWSLGGTVTVFKSGISNTKWEVVRLGLQARSSSQRAWRAIKRSEFHHDSNGGTQKRFKREVT